MKKIFFSFNSDKKLTESLARKCNAEVGKFIFRNFPDGEAYLRILSEVKNKKIVFVCRLSQPDEKILPIYFFCRTAKDLGAKEICFVVPYLAYMRQDKQFNSGEGITSKYFAQLISSFADELITVDPHLHRIKNLSDIYSIKTNVLHASELISFWIKKNILNPVLIGPDSESKQWVGEIARNANVPFIVLNKIRNGDTNVQVSIPHLEKFNNCTPVLVDDIISTAHTMIETIYHLKKLRMKKPICIGIHGIFAGTAFQDLKKAGVKEIITCNTILHRSNKIDVSKLLAEEI